MGLKKWENSLSPVPGTVPVDLPSGEHTLVPACTATEKL